MQNDTNLRLKSLTDYKFDKKFYKIGQSNSIITTDDSRPILDERRYGVQHSRGVHKLAPGYGGGSVLAEIRDQSSAKPVHDGVG